MRLKFGLLPLSLFFLSVGLIFFQFNLIPKNLAYDEVEFARLALSLDGKPYTPYSPLATGHSTLYFYIILISLKIFGLTKSALRLPSTLFAIGSVMVFYKICEYIFKQYNPLPIKQSLNLNRTIKPRQTWLEQLNNNYLSFLSAIILLTSHWFLTFARFSFEATFLLFLKLCTVYFLLFIFNKNVSRFTLYVLCAMSGLFAGLAFNSYPPGRIFFLLPLGLIIYNLLKQSNNRTIEQFFYFIIPFIITITPLTAYLITHPDPRFESQFFLSNETLTFSTKINYLWQNIRSTALMFITNGDMNGRHNYPGKPALNPILGGLFIIGLFFGIKNYKKNLTNLVAIFYLLLSIFPALLTYPWENPNMLRTFTVLPATVYFIATGLNIVIVTLKKILRIKTSFIVFILSALIFVSSVYEIRTYFKYQRRVFNNAFEIKCPLNQAVYYADYLLFKNCGVKKNEF